MSVTAPPIVTSLPLPPDPNDRATFNARAYPWAAAQGVFTDEINSIAENVNSNAGVAFDSALIAQASANHKGNYSDLIGALSVPASVSHAGSVWLLNYNIADVVSHVPGSSPAWQIVSPWQMPVDLRTGNTELTNVDQGKIISASASFTQTIALASTLRDGWFVHFHNDGYANITITPTSPNLVNDMKSLKVFPGERYILAKSGIGFYAAKVGERAFQKASAATILHTYSTFDANQSPICRLNDSQFIAFYRSGTTLKARIGTVDSLDDITLGTEYSDAQTTNTAFTACRIADSKYLVVTYKSATKYQAQVVTVSGGVVTFNTYVEFGTYASNNTGVMSLCSPTDDVAILYYQSDATPTYSMAKITITGTSFTVGTGASAGTTELYGELMPISATQVVAFSNDNADGAIRVVDVSGATPVMGTAQALTTNMLAAVSMGSGNFVYFRKNEAAAPPGLLAYVSTSSGATTWTSSIGELQQFMDKDTAWASGIGFAWASGDTIYLCFAGGNTNRLTRSVLALKYPSMEIVGKYSLTNYIDPTGADGLREKSFAVLRDGLMVCVVSSNNRNAINIVRY